jgi:hypothetical protein
LIDRFAEPAYDFRMEEVERDRQVERAERLYQAGDYKLARALAKKRLEDETLSSDDRKAAEQILRATGTDPVAALAILFTFCLLVFLVLKYAF